MRPGADAKDAKKWAVAMKQLFPALVACLLLVAAAPPPEEPQAQIPESGGEPSLCLDGMEDMPMNDDLVPVPAGMDGGCSIPDDVIST
jgi:hypothetical protein